MKPSEDVTGIRWKISHVTVSSNENTVIVKISVMMEVYFLGGGWVGLDSQKKRKRKCLDFIMIMVLMIVYLYKTVLIMDPWWSMDPTLNT